MDNFVFCNDAEGLLKGLGFSKRPDESKNLSEEQLVQSEKMFLPPLHIKLGRMKNFAKVINKDAEGNY